MLLDFGGNLTVPENFEHTALPLDQKGPSAANEVGVSYFSLHFSGHHLNTFLIDHIYLWPPSPWVTFSSLYL